MTDRDRLIHKIMSLKKPTISLQTAMDIVDAIIDTDRCKDCAGCTNWFCDCSNIYQQCVEDIKEFYKENKFGYEAEKLGEELDEFLEEHFKN